ncbi:MAG: TRAP transporter small permease [Clostridia bacterium]|nr:TRAP transporter small permease [Clostridia bacterium]NCC68252.1 TRAP transporter small permease [Clostridia bacterium]
MKCTAANRERVPAPDSLAVRAIPGNKGGPPLKKFFKALWDYLLKFEHAVVVVCCIAIVGLVFLTVILRYVFKTSFQGMEELVMLFAFGIYFIGGAIGSHDESQISADVMSIFIRRPKSVFTLRAIQNLVDAALIFTCGVFATRQMLFVLGEGSRTVGLKMPTWIIYTIILVGLFLMAMYSVYHFVNYLAKKRTLSRAGNEAEECN